jgi:hypothetical protein
MSGPYHEDELRIQERFGVREPAQAVGRTIAAGISAAAARFVLRQRFAVAASIDARGTVWASPLFGRHGFATAVDRQLLHLATAPTAGDPLRDDLTARPELGLLMIDLTTRQRMRFNGRGLLADNGLFLSVAQVYGNCPKYIQRRTELPDAPPRPSPPRVSERLDERQAAWIAGADTLFVASHHPEGGADASHRGGSPGFVEVLGPRRMAFPDYPGNAMFNTLGNLVANPAIGLLFVDFAAGDVLQLAGQAEVGPEGQVTVAIEVVRESPGACPLRYAFAERSPANPPLVTRPGPPASQAVIGPASPAGRGRT